MHIKMCIEMCVCVCSSIHTMRTGDWRFSFQNQLMNNFAMFTSLLSTGKATKNKDMSF